MSSFSIPRKCPFLRGILANQKLCRLAKVAKRIRLCQRDSFTCRTLFFRLIKATEQRQKDARQTALTGAIHPAEIPSIAEWLRRAPHDGPKP